jgi:predicted dehydrogenase
MVLAPDLDDRYGSGKVTSRIGIEAEAITFLPADNLFAAVESACNPEPINCVLIDEAQFLTKEQVFQLSDVTDKLNIAGIGIGGMGHSNINNLNSQNIVALCDVDWNYSAGIFEKYPDAKKFKDYRMMFDKMGDQIDAVVIATPDHTHAISALAAMSLGKHVYVQKPLTHTVYESRMLRMKAKEYGVATQMGNQGNSGDGVRDICNWLWNGAIGEVKRVHAWTNRPIWPQGLQRPTEEMAVPDTLDWDLFTGPAKMRPYHEAYTPWNWRGWWDFGTGAFGDMACHVLDPVSRALKLGYPDKVRGSSTTINTEYHKFSPVQKPKSKICIGWTGTTTTVKHYETAIPVLKRLKEKYGDKIYFKVIVNHAEWTRDIEVKLSTWTRESEISELCEFDIGIMPLPNDEWSRGKCGFKGLQCMSLEMPVVMSPVGVNTDIVNHEVNGFLASTDDEWFQHLCKLIESPELRKSIGQEGRKTIQESYSVEKWESVVLEEFEKISI